MSSLLKLQSRNVKDEQQIEMLKESQNRIKAMALIHEKLYRSKDFANVEFNDYIKDLVNDLFASYKISNSRIALKLDIKNISLGIDTAIPCGLIVNELVSNSLKYAFPEGKDGEIRISLHKIADFACWPARRGLQNEDLKSEIYELVVSDNGVGISQDMDFRNTDSLGLRLITNLAENQLQGKVEINRDKGTKFQIKFKEAKYKQRI
jgi:two-component sensor histidine kinase